MFDMINVGFVDAPSIDDNRFFITYLARLDLQDNTYSREWVWTPRGGYYFHKSPKWGVAWQTRN